MDFFACCGDRVVYDRGGSDLYSLRKNMEYNLSQAKKVTLEATIIRADGRIEPLGVVSAWHRNPFIRLWYRIRGLGRVRVAKNHQL